VHASTLATVFDEHREGDADLGPTPEHMPAGKERGHVFINALNTF